MQKTPFEFSYSVAFLTAFTPPKKWWRINKLHKLDLPVLNDADFSHTANKTSLTNLYDEIEVTYLTKQFLETNNGRMYVSNYITQLSNLSEIHRNHIKSFAADFISYSIDLIIENSASHSNPVTVDAFELHGTEEILRTARALKNAQLSGKKLILNDDSIDNFTEEYLYLADYWHIDNDTIEMRYIDWEAEDDAEAEKVHTANFDSKPFVLQFNNIAHNITDLINKICLSLQISVQDLDRRSLQDLEQISKE